MKKAIIIIIIILIIGGAAAYFIKSKKPKEEYTFATIAKGTIIQTVSETGKVKAENNIDLSFQTAGQVENVYVKIGDSVQKDQVLAELDSNNLKIKKNEAGANLEVAKQELKKLLAGATNEEIKVADANVKQSQEAYDSAQKELAQTKTTTDENVSQAQKTLDDLIDSDSTTYTPTEQAISAAQTNYNNKKVNYQKEINNNLDIALTAAKEKISTAKSALDIINQTVNDEELKKLLSIKNPSYLNDTSTYYNKSVVLLADLEKRVKNLDFNQDIESTQALINDVSQLLNTTFNALNNCTYALDNTTTSSSLSQAAINNFKTNVNTQISNINSAVSSIQKTQQTLNSAVLDYNINMSNAEEDLAKAKTSYDDAVIKARNSLSSAKVDQSQKMTSAQSKISSTQEALKVAQANYDKVIAKATVYDIALAQAKIKQTEANLSAIENDIKNTILTAPIAGVVTSVKYDPGEQVSPGVAAISFFQENNYVVEVDVSEADIEKIKIGNPAEITFDAFGDDIKFPAKVSFIEPGSTIIQDVIYYKVKIAFEPGTYQVKPDMTANVVITTNIKEGVLIIPGRAIVDRNGEGKFVKILINGQVEEKPIEIGLRGDGGETEIIKGVSEGENVITYVSTEGTK